MGELTDPESTDAGGYIHHSAETTQNCPVVLASTTLLSAVYLATPYAVHLQKANTKFHKVE